MRRRITKGSIGRSAVGKEVSVKVIKAGLSVDGTQRWNASIRFLGDSYKKASSGDYVAIEVDDEQKRLYFVTADEKEGFKLSTSSVNCKTVSFTVNDVTEWEQRIGEYDLKKDISDGSYYIDIAQ